MITLRMLVTQPGSLNGRDVRTYERGEVVDLPDQGPGGLADVFLREGWAERVEETPRDVQVSAPVEVPAPLAPRRRKPRA